MRVFARSLNILERNRDLLDAAAAELLERETLGDEDVARLSERLKRERVAAVAS